MDVQPARPNAIISMGRMPAWVPPKFASESSCTGRNVDENAVLRAIELTVTKYCPAQIMLQQAFPMDLHYEIYEDEGEGNKRLTHQGIWQEVLPE